MTPDTEALRERIMDILHDHLEVEYVGPWIGGKEKAADAILALLPPASDREGFVLVPVEPTEAMLIAAGATPDGVSPRGGKDYLRRMLPKYWRAMLAAATKGPKEQNPINQAHRYLIKRNSDRAFIGSTDDLGISLEVGCILVDTIGVDGLGPGIARYLAYRRAAPTVQP